MFLLLSKFSVEVSSCKTLYRVKEPERTATRYKGNTVMKHKFAESSAFCDGTKGLSKMGLQSPDFTNFSSKTNANCQITVFLNALLTYLIHGSLYRVKHKAVKCLSIQYLRLLL